jgi:hypothetical protein
MPADLALAIEVDRRICNPVGNRLRRFERTIGKVTLSGKEQRAVVSGMGGVGDGGIGDAFCNAEQVINVAPFLPCCDVGLLVLTLFSRRSLGNPARGSWAGKHLLAVLATSASRRHTARHMEVFFTPG